MKYDKIHKAKHYNQLPIECIDVVKYFNFCLGNAIKYIWRAGLKHNTKDDLEKALYYIKKELENYETIQTSGRVYKKKS